MNEVGPISDPQAPVAVKNGRQPRHTSQAAARTTRASDCAEFSQAARLLSKLAELPDVRQDLIDRVRAEIDAGTYETSERIDAAIDRLPEDLS